ncbi:hypothetical protein F4778DRAFT_790515 [Xylariomycetidae sp. FL2044]|nr:hypothetical protein F4778DRAFT_790515 [Xylariomycetidae sp. FL2044]
MRLWRPLMRAPHVHPPRPASEVEAGLMRKLPKHLRRPVTSEPFHFNFDAAAKECEISLELPGGEKPRVLRCTVEEAIREHIKPGVVLWPAPLQDVGAAGGSSSSRDPDGGSGHNSFISNSNNDEDKKTTQAVIIPHYQLHDLIPKEAEKARTRFKDGGKPPIGETLRLAKVARQQGRLDQLQLKPPVLAPFATSGNAVAAVRAASAWLQVHRHLAFAVPTGSLLFYRKAGWVASGLLPWRPPRQTALRQGSVDRELLDARLRRLPHVWPNVLRRSVVGPMKVPDDLEAELRFVKGELTRLIWTLRPVQKSKEERKREREKNREENEGREKEREERTKGEGE